MGLIIMMVLMMIIMIMIRLSQPAAAGLRGYGERVGKWRGNEEMEGEWGNGDKERFPPSPIRLFLSISSFSSHFLSIYDISLDLECLENLNTRIMRKLF